MHIMKMKKDSQPKQKQKNAEKKTRYARVKER